MSESLAGLHAAPVDLNMLETALPRYSPVYANGRQIKNGCSATHDIKSDPRVTQYVTQKPVRTVKLKWKKTEQKNSIIYLASRLDRITN